MLKKETEQRNFTFLFYFTLLHFTLTRIKAQLKYLLMEAFSH